MSSSRRARVTAAGTSEKKYRVPWGTGGKSESVSSGNGGMAAAVLPPGGVSVENKKIKRK